MQEDIILRENIENMREQFFNYIFLCCRNNFFCEAPKGNIPINCHSDA